MVTVAIFSSTPLWELHHAEMVELALRERESGSRVLIFSCDRFYASCPANPWKEENLCRACIKQTKRTNEVFLSEAEGFEHISLPAQTGGQLKLQQLVSSREELLAYKHYDAPIGSLVVSQMSDEKSDTLFTLDTPKDLERANLLLASGIDLYDLSRQRMLDEQVDKCFVWNGRRPSDGPAWWAARSIGVDASIFISGSRFGEMVLLPQSSVQDDSHDRSRLVARRAELEETGRLEEAVEEGAHFLARYRAGSVDAIGWQDWRSKEQTRPVFNKPSVLLLLSSPIEEVHLESFQKFFLPDPYFWINQVIEAVGEMLPTHQVVVKWHPHQAQLLGNEARLIDEKIQQARNGSVHFAPDSNADAYWLAQNADIVFSTGSTVGSWAASIGKPLFVIGPDGELFQEGSYWISDKNVRNQVVQTLQEHKGAPPAKNGDEVKLAIAVHANRGFKFKFVSASPGSDAVMLGMKRLSALRRAPLRRLLRLFLKKIFSK